MKQLNILNKNAANIFKKFKEEIEDIIVFGSSMKGKEKPNDIDILVVFKKQINKKIESELKKEINIVNLDINSTTVEELKSEGFIAKEGIYLEGFSLIHNKSLNDLIGFGSFGLIKYDLSNIKGSNRVMFYYALLGRNKKGGFLKEIMAKRFSESVIICDYSVIEKAKDFFLQWNIKCQIIPVLIPNRLKKIMLE